MATGDSQHCRSRTFKLLSGREMPLIGYGTFRVNGQATIRQVLEDALAAGYRSIDTATVYNNESDIGLALKELLPKYNLRREDIFITSKLSPSDQGERAYNAVTKSLQKLQCGYLDLYLIHWPGSGHVSSQSEQNASLRATSWRSLIRAKHDGLIRDVGVSNYTVRHLTELLCNCNGIKPVVNQVEWHPACYDPQLKQLCDREGILLQAYSSLGGTDNESLLKSDIVSDIAQRLKRSPAQVLLRWAIQQNVGILPKSISCDHIRANIDLNFELDNKDMETLCSQRQERYAWNPHNVK